MAIGLHPKTGNIPGFSAPVIYDKGIQQTVKPRVLKAQFGDGYEMRVRDGINNTPREWSLHLTIELRRILIIYMISLTD